VKEKIQFKREIRKKWRGMGEERGNSLIVNMYLDENVFAAVEAMTLRVFPFVMNRLISSAASRT